LFNECLLVVGAAPHISQFCWLFGCVAWFVYPAPSISKEDCPPHTSGRDFRWKHGTESLLRSMSGIFSLGMPATDRQLCICWPNVLRKRRMDEQVVPLISKVASWWACRFLNVCVVLRRRQPQSVKDVCVVLVDHTHRHTDTQTHRHTDSQTHRHTDRHTHAHRTTHRQTHTHTNTHTHIHTHTHTRKHAQACACACTNAIMLVPTYPCTTGLQYNKHKLGSDMMFLRFGCTAKVRNYWHQRPLRLDKHFGEIPLQLWNNHVCGTSSSEDIVMCFESVVGLFKYI
jgi:hypothetical protein